MVYWLVSLEVSVGMGMNPDSTTVCSGDIIHEATWDVTQLTCTVSRVGEKEAEYKETEN